MADENIVQAKSEIRVKFFELLFGDTKGYLCIATSDKIARDITFSQKFFEWPKEAITVENYILKAENQLNVYFCINLLSKAERKKEYCLPTNLVWADLDMIDPQSITKIPPPITIRSSTGRWQAIWRLTETVSPPRAEDYSRRMSYLIGADKSGWDLTQLLRVPMTWNRKYDPPVFIELERALGTTAKPMLFDALPEFSNLSGGSKFPMPDMKEITVEAVLHKYKKLYNGSRFASLYAGEPREDWSADLWALERLCFNVGMHREEVFAVASTATCNKYARDNRPAEDLWQEVLKAEETFANKWTTSDRLIELPKFVEEPHSETFVDEYREWANEITDAVPDFHNICCFVMLSAIIASSVRIETSVGTIVPNLWGLILGDSTLTRKTTSMKLAMEFLAAMDKDVIISTDATAEGLLQAISQRPNKVSVFHKDEVSGLFESMTKKDYMAGFQETLTALYDAPQYYKRTLSKNVIILESPIFVTLAGGVADRTHASMNEEFVLSGFLPRFLVVYGEAKAKTRRMMGPPKETGVGKRPEIFSKLADLYEIYSTEVQTKIGGQSVLMPARYKAILTDDAWKKSAEIEMTLLVAGADSLIGDIALPTLDRLAKHILKMAVILAATRQRPTPDGIITVEESDVINAAWYGQRWAFNSIELAMSAGKGPKEILLEKVWLFIQANPGIWRSSILRRFHLDAQEGSKILQTLEEREMVVKEKVGKGYKYWVYEDAPSTWGIDLTNEGDYDDSEDGTS